MLLCSVLFSYDRFFTRFNYEDSNQSVLNTSEGVVNSNDLVRRLGGQGGRPLGSTTKRQGGAVKDGVRIY